MIVFRKKVSDIDACGMGIHILDCGILEFRQVDYHLLRPTGTGDYQLLYVTEGVGYFYLDGNVSVVTPGHAVLYAPGQTQEYGYPEKEGAIVFYCHFSGKGIEAFLRDYSIPTQQVFYGGKNFSFFLNRLLEDSVGMGGPSAAALGLLNLLQYAAKQLRPQAVKVCDPVDLVLADIRENYMLNRSVEEYAILCHFSKYHFLRRFKKKTGTTPISYRNEYRLSIAQRLLTDSNLTVEAVAEAVGFSSPSYFCRLYKKSRGCSPRGT